MSRKEELLKEYTQRLDSIKNNATLVYLATDTYDMLKGAGYNENEALKLTEVICSNKWERDKTMFLDLYARGVIPKGR